jgi:hypothetical protein
LWLALLGIVLCNVPAAHADISVTVIPSLAPNAFGSPSWSEYAASAVYAIEHGLSAYGDPTKPSYYQANSTPYANQALVTTFNSWMGWADPGTVFGAAFANELGNRMHFGLHITATGGQTFSLDQLSFAENSTDPLTAADPSTGLTYSWPAGPWSYSPVRVGLIHNPDSTVTRVESGSASQPVDEFIYVGSGDAFWPGDPSNWACTGCTTAQKQAYIDDVALSLGAYTFTGTYTIQGVSGSGAFQVAAVPEPSAVALMLTAVGLAGLGFRRRMRRG